MIRLQFITHAKVLNDVAGRACADGPQCVLHCIIQLHLFAFVQEARSVLNDLRIQRVIDSVTWLVAVISDLFRAIDCDQQWVQVKIIKMRRTTANLRQQIGTADNIIQRTRTDASEDFAYFGCVEGDQVHDLICVTSELVAQCLVLCTYADGASV